MKLKTGLLLIALSASGCAAISTSPDYCSTYTAVPTLHCGSPQQQLAVDQNNAVYMALCLRE